MSMLSDIQSSQNGVSRSPSEGKLDQTIAIMPMPSSGPVLGPTTNLNIGMDYWANTTSSTPGVHGKATPTTIPGAVVPAEQWIQVCSYFNLRTIIAPMENCLFLFRSAL